MAKSKSVVSVFIDVAELVWETREIKTNDEWGEWAQTFVEALATQNFEINGFATKLLMRVLEFRKSEAERISEIRDKKAKSVQVQSVQNVQTTVHTERKKDQDLKKKDFAPTNLNLREQKFKTEIQAFESKYDNKLLTAFFEYWSEPNKSKTKMKFELQKTWELSRRLKTWSSNDFGNKNNRLKTFAEIDDERLGDHLDKLKRQLNG